MNNTVIGKVTATEKAFSIEGKKYELTPQAQEITTKLDLNGRTIMAATNKDGKIAIIRTGGLLTYKERTKRYNSEDTYLADYVVSIGWPCNIKEDSSPYRLAFVCYTNKDQREFLNINVWDEELVARLKVELKVPEGEKLPKMWIRARKSTRNLPPKEEGGEKRVVTNYTLEDFGVITD